MYYFIFRHRNWGRGETVAWNMILVNNFKMTKSSRVRCMSTGLFFYTPTRIGKTGCFCYSHLLWFSSASCPTDKPCGPSGWDGD